MDIVIEESDDDDAVEDITFSTPPKIFSLTVAFLLTFRVIYNISDHALVLLLWFFKYLFLLIGTAFGVNELKQPVHFPQSIHGCYSYLNLDPTPYKEYVVCPSCHTLYDQSLKPLVLGTSRNPQSARCSVVEFPDHPQQRFRQPCNTFLLHSVQKKQNKIFKPRKVYY